MRKETIVTTGIGVLAVCAAFFGGAMWADDDSVAPVTLPDKGEISIVHLQKLVGDAVVLETSGPVRVVWGKGERMVEGDGVHNIPLSQLPTEDDMKLDEFPFLGNEKTNKFYPSDSYPARGTEVIHRRFFDSYEAAISAGFEPSKDAERAQEESGENTNTPEG